MQKNKAHNERCLQYFSYLCKQRIHMSSKDCLKRMSKILFWDIDIEEADMDKYPAHFIQRVLEYGTMDDWRLLRAYYGLPKIVEECTSLCIYTRRNRNVE